MDNEKTGLLIRELRKEKGMTQKDLAQLLHITDRAVSKWERGLCAPDLSLLEPLANALDVSILELISGERAAPTERTAEHEETVKRTIAYSSWEIARKVGTIRKQYLSTIILCLAAAAALCAFLLWRGGYLFVVDRIPSPDGNTVITVYSKELSGSGFSMKDAVSLIVKHKDGGEWRITYGNCAYQGIWWAPDSQKYVLALKYGDTVQLALAWLEHSSESNLSAYLSMGVELAELSQNGYSFQGTFPDIEYQFLQWGLDSQSMLIYYSFEDPQGELHEGYFWYNCETGTVSAVLQLDS